MDVFYSSKMVADQGEQGFGNHILKSPSARKPAELAALLYDYPDIHIVEPLPLTIDDFKLSHDPIYVDGIMNLTEDNGFGNRSQAVVDSLPYTNGAMYDAARSATVDLPTCALVSGFHHAGYGGWKNLGYFCTFNGLTITAAKLVQEGKKVAIIDCDMHWGNGTDDVLWRSPNLLDKVLHITFGRFFTSPSHADKYLKWLDHDESVYFRLNEFKPDVILYQAGADVHVDDPYGGVLTTEQIKERDRRMFRLAKYLHVPLAWNLAGGYQVDKDGSIQKVLDIHLNTFDAWREVYDRSN